MKFAVLALLVASAQAADPVCVASLKTYSTNNCSGNGTDGGNQTTTMNTQQVTWHKANCTVDNAQSFKYVCSSTGGVATYYAGGNCSGNATNASGNAIANSWTAGKCTEISAGKWGIIKSGIAAPKKTNNTTGDKNKTGNNTSNSTNNSSGAQALAATFAASAALLATVY